MLLTWIVWIAMPCLLSLSSAVPAGEISLPRPKEGQMVVDRAEMISEEDEKAINDISNRLLKATGNPIIVVTIESMAKYGGGEKGIEEFARRLFDQWGIGTALVDGNPSNRGILLLIARADRKARIELGAGWERDRDKETQAIMDGIIIPHFRKEAFSTGVLEGVKALNRMAVKTKPKPDCGAMADDYDDTGSVQHFRTRSGICTRFLLQTFDRKRPFQEEDEHGTQETTRGRSGAAG